MRHAGPDAGQPSTAAQSLGTGPVSVTASRVILLNAAPGESGAEEIQDGALIVPAGVRLQFRAHAATTRSLAFEAAGPYGNSPLEARIPAVLPLAVLQGHVRVTITVPVDGKTRLHTIILQADTAALSRQVDGGWLVQFDAGVLRVGPS